MSDVSTPLPGQGGSPSDGSLIVLFDNPSDGIVEFTGWVAGVESEDIARNVLAEFCVAGDGEGVYRPTGPARVVHLRPEDGHAPDAGVEEQMWEECPPDADHARAFWEVAV